MAFEIPDTSEVWRQIPPEEKVELINKAHAAGVLATSISLIIIFTASIGLQLPWLMWGALICAPFVFQFASGKRWRHLRPKVMLEYLAARSAARRFAYAAGSKDMRVMMIFRGYLEEVFDADHRSEELEAEISDRKETPVWVALFTDCIVMMSERPGGAELEFGYLMNERMRIEGKSPSGEDEYSSNREISIRVHDRVRGEHSYTLSSHFPAALIVFEKKASKFLQEWNEINKVPMDVQSFSSIFDKSGDAESRF